MPASSNRALQVTALADLGLKAVDDNRLQEAAEHLNRAFALARSLGDLGREADVLAILGLAALKAGQADAARKQLEEAVRLARLAGDPLTEKLALERLATVAAFQGDMPAAQDLLAAAIDLARALGDQQHEANLLWHSAILYAEDGNVDRAVETGQSAIALLESLGKPKARVYAEHLETFRNRVARNELPAKGVVVAATPFAGSSGRATRATQAAAKTPGLLRMAISAAGALGRFAGSGLKILDNNAQQQRLDACRKCEHFTGMRCRACGCFTALKAKLPHEDCPLGKWPKVAGTGPVPSAQDVCPEGASVNPAKANGLESTPTPSPSSGPTAQPFISHGRKTVGPLGRRKRDGGAADSQGCALCWGNGWAFGPHVVRQAGPKHVGQVANLPGRLAICPTTRATRRKRPSSLVRRLRFEHLETRSVLNAAGPTPAVNIGGPALASSLVPPYVAAFPPAQTRSTVTPAPQMISPLPPAVLSRMGEGQGVRAATTFDPNSPLLLDNAAGKPVDITLDSNTLVVAAATWCPHCHDFINWLREPAVQTDLAGLKIVFAFGDESAAGNGSIYDPSWLLNDPGQVLFLDAKSAARPTSYPEIYDPALGSFTEAMDAYTWIDNWIVAGTRRVPPAVPLADGTGPVPATFDTNSPLKLDDASGKPVNVTLDANTLVIGAATWCMHCHDFINWLRQPDVQAEVSGLNVVFAFGDESAMGYGKTYDPSWLVNDPGEVAFIDPSSTARPTAFPEIYDPLAGGFSEQTSPYQWINTWLVGQGRAAISDLPAEAVSATKVAGTVPVPATFSVSTTVMGPVIPLGVTPGPTPGPTPVQTIYVTPADSFITTSTSYPPLTNTFNGVNGADWTCTNAASDAGLIPGWDGLTTIYTALVSTSSENASSHINLQGELQNYAGQVVATSSANLWSGSLANAVLYDFNGDAVTSANKVLTGTNPSGSYTTFSCGDLNSKSGIGSIGNPTSATSTWVTSSTSLCSSAFRLYCVSPPPLPTTIGAGMNIVLEYVNQYPTDATVAISGGGSLDLNGLTQTLAGIAIDNGTLLSSVPGGNLSVTGSILTQTATVSADLSGPGTFTEDTVGATTLSGANTYTGGTIANGGTLTIATSASLPSGYPLTVNAGTVNIGTGSGVSVNVSTLTVNGGTLANGTITSSSNYVVKSGTISTGLGGTGGLTKTGSGIVTLSGSNTYQGQTAVTAGTLVVTSPAALPAGATVTVGSFP